MEESAPLPSRKPAYNCTFTLINALDPHIQTTKTEVQISLIKLRKCIASYKYIHYIPLNFKSNCTRPPDRCGRGRGQPKVRVKATEMWFTKFSASIGRRKFRVLWRKFWKFGVPSEGNLKLGFPLNKVVNMWGLQCIEENWKFWTLIVEIALFERKLN